MRQRIVSLTRGNTVCERVTLAERPLRRMWGLLGRRSLPAGEGLLLRPEPAIHTAFMRFPIDALFLDNDLRVLEVVADLRPWRTAGKRGAHAVLEMAAGEAARNDVVVGDRLAVFERKAPAVNGDHQLNGDDDGDEDWNEPTPWDFLPMSEILPSREQALAGGAQPHQVRVLLIARDRRFRTVASALLTRRGCGVTISPNPARIEELVERDGIGVVVIDAGPMLTAAARTVAAVESLAPPVGVVVVADEAEAGLHGMTVLAKWGPFEEFFDAIEQADRDRGRRSRLVG